MIACDWIIDGIFLDYHWTEDAPTVSAECVAGLGRSGAEVFVGVDVWGRGTFGGGQWNTAAAAKVTLESFSRIFP